MDFSSASSCPRPGYPRPDLVRPIWRNLNGVWEFAEDPGRSGRSRSLFRTDAPFPDRITVPFCRESNLSGLAHRDFCDAVWYRRAVHIPDEWRKLGRRILFHIGACDYHTEVWVNGISVGTHIGGMNAFSFDVTDALCREEEQIITITATDLLREGKQCGGKQSPVYESHGCFYTRTTGIWQTVWMESVPASYIRSLRLFPDPANRKLTLEAKIAGGEGKTLLARTSYAGNPTGESEGIVSGHHVTLEIPLTELHLWEIGQGRLYDLSLRLEGEDPDCVESYFGMRQVCAREGILYLNGKPIFQRLVLDQGFYPDGIWTAPTDEALRDDIERSIAMGFHGARLHQKVFEPRFLYECDRAGYLVWGEHGNWGMDITSPTAYAAILPDWLEILERDCNHPAIIGWCPLNETDGSQDPELVRLLAALTRAIDPTRPYIEASGWTHIPGLGDFLDIHCYEQNPEAFASRLAPLAQGKEIDLYPWPGGMRGQPTFVSEYGGIYWASKDTKGWGYGNAPQSEEEFVERFRGLADVLLRHPHISGLCYTQLTDVEQEMNGLYTFDRQPKFDPAQIRAILSRKAAIEEATMSGD